jgi:hypothetical protein
MVKSPKKAPKIADEPGAEDRFLSGVRKALETPHKPHKPKDVPGSKGTGKTKGRS